MAKKFKWHTRRERLQYAKQFTKKERASYRKGKRYGFLIGIHAHRRKKTN